jgi:hypothetical protein
MKTRRKGDRLAKASEAKLEALSVYLHKGSLVAETEKTTLFVDSNGSIWCFSPD